MEADWRKNVIWKEMETTKISTNKWSQEDTMVDLARKQGEQREAKRWMVIKKKIKLVAFTASYCGFTIIKNTWVSGNKLGYRKLWHRNSPTYLKLLKSISKQKGIAVHLPTCCGGICSIRSTWRCLHLILVPHITAQQTEHCNRNSRKKFWHKTRM